MILNIILGRVDMVVILYNVLIFYWNKEFNMLYKYIIKEFYW